MRGALINIVLNHNAEDRGKLQGEIYGKYANEYAGSAQGRGSLLYTKGKFSTDLIYTYDFAQTHNDNSLEARHRLSDGSIHDIVEKELVDTREKSHQVIRSAGVPIISSVRITGPAWCITGTSGSLERI